MAVDANSTSRLAVLYRGQLIGGGRQKPRPGSPTNGPKRDRPSCAMGQSYWPQGVGWVGVRALKMNGSLGFRGGFRVQAMSEMAPSRAQEME